MMALAAVTAAEYSLVYPALVIISISIRPNPEASAVADPEIPRKQHTCQNIDVCQTAPYMSHQGIAEFYDAHGQSAAAHDLAGQNEQRDTHIGEIVYTGKHFLRDDNHGSISDGERRNGHKAHGES